RPPGGAASRPTTRPRGRPSCSTSPGWRRCSSRRCSRSRWPADPLRSREAPGPSYPCAPEAGSSTVTVQVARPRRHTDEGETMPIHGSLFTDFEEAATSDQFSLQNKKLLKVQMGHGPVMAKLGSMVAYQGDVRFENKGSGGIGKFLKQA